MLDVYDHEDIDLNLAKTSHSLVHVEIEGKEFTVIPVGSVCRDMSMHPSRHRDLSF